MFINDVHKKEEIQNIAVQHLKKYGIKYRPKKPRPPQQGVRTNKKFFKVPLQCLETETVTLSNGQQLVIPKRIQELCSYILSKVETEGIFRKEGSKSRQHEIKLSLDRGCHLGTEHHVIDVAVVLKCFLRELPEPLIPPTHNDLFLMCSVGKRSKEELLECLLLACLLLPSENLNVLSYLMQFFYEVASYATYNKMTFSNLAILVGPNIFPIDSVPKSSLTITRICDITKLLIEHSKRIGFIPDYIIEQIGQLNVAEQDKAKKKRRSGSLTRMFNGLRKIVSTTVRHEEASSRAPPDILTPSIQNTVKKRKSDTGMSLKRKKEVVNKLPDCALLNTPFTPVKTPISVNPNGKKPQELLSDAVGELNSSKEKKMHWYLRSRSMKSLKEEEGGAMGSNRRGSLGPRSLLERRWSAVSNAGNFRKKKRTTITTKPAKNEEPDYVRVPKTEFEEFKHRVSAIERRISLELDNVQSRMDHDNDNNVNREINIENVQTAYQMTLETGSLSPTTDQLVRRFSRDLRIRRSGDQKAFRSPSARKIGSIRRRSTERGKKSVQIVRNQSWHLGTTPSDQISAPLLPRVSLRRKKRLSKENVIISRINLESEVRLKQVNGCYVKIRITPPPNMEMHKPVQRTSSFPRASMRRKIKLRHSGSPNSFNMETSLIHQSSPKLGVNTSESTAYSSACDNTSGTSNEHWLSAEEFLNTSEPSQQDTSRASIAKLRSQNVGMVRAKAKMFDTLKNPEIPSRATKKMSKTTSICEGLSSGSARMSTRVRTLKAEDKRNSPSHRRKTTQKQKLQQIGRQYVKNPSNASIENYSVNKLVSPNRIIQDSPRRTPRQPYIKSPLTVKTPKRLCRTPAVDKKRTPFRVMATPL